MFGPSPGPVAPGVGALSSSTLSAPQAQPQSLMGMQQMQGMPQAPQGMLGMPQGSPLASQAPGAFGQAPTSAGPGNVFAAPPQPSAYNPASAGGFASGAPGGMFGRGLR